MGVVCVVQARTGSSRLPGKVLMELGGRPMLAFMLDRISGLPVDEVVVATSALARDDAVADIAAGAGIAVVRGSETDVLDRFATALAAHPADHVVRLTADCPLTDPEIVGSVIACHLERDADYTCNVLPRSFPKGLDVEVARASALLTAAREANEPAEREHVMPFLYRRPERFRLARVTTPEALGHERWTVDTADDLEFVREALATAGDPYAGWRAILAAVGRRVTPRAGEVWLRPARADDAPLLFEWRNDATTVRFSGTGRAVAAAEHERWLDARLGDAATRIWIGEVDGRAVGQVRVDVRDAIGELDVAVAPDARGRGYGRGLLDALLVELRGDLQARRLVAAVHVDNVASQRAFVGCGFVADGANDGFDQFRLELASS